MGQWSLLISVGLCLAFQIKYSRLRNDPIPPSGCLLNNAGNVLGPKISLRGEIIGRRGDAAEVVLFILITFLDRGSLIAAALAFGAYAGEWDERTGSRGHHVDRSRAIVIQIPPGECCQRHEKFGHADAGKIVAIGIGLRDESRVSGTQ